MIYEMKGTDEDPFTLEELQEAIIPPDSLGKIVIVVNKKHHKVNVQSENLSDKEIKGILKDVFIKYC